MQPGQSGFDLMGHQRRWEQEGEALESFLEATKRIKGIEDELHTHNEQFRDLNNQLHKESKAREEGDRKNRRFTIYAVFLTCALTFFYDHLFDIYRFLFPS